MRKGENRHQYRFGKAVIEFEVVDPGDAAPFTRLLVHSFEEGFSLEVRIDDLECIILDNEEH